MVQPSARTRPPHTRDGYRVLVERLWPRGELDGCASSAPHPNTLAHPREQSRTPAQTDTKVS